MTPASFVLQQILACGLAGLCVDPVKGDILVEWVNALNRWINVTIWNKTPNDLTLAELDKLLFKFQDPSEAIAHLRKNPKGDTLGWDGVPKMGQLAFFVPTIIRVGHTE